MTRERELERICKEAKGSSVTRQKLTGDERYYPDVSHLFVGEQAIFDQKPHYIVLLTSSGASVYQGRPVMPASFFEIVFDKSYTEYNELCAGNSCIVLTEKFFICVTDAVKSGHSGGYFQIPYDSITSAGGSNIIGGGEISVASSGVEYSFDLANTHGDGENVAKAMKYMNKKI